MSQAPNKTTIVAETAVPPHPGVDVADGPDASLASVRPWRAWPGDAREAAATRRARLWAVLLMALSSVVAIVLLGAAWLLLPRLF